jgi:hypothetical protein
VLADLKILAIDELDAAIESVLHENGQTHEEAN